mgnify:CR=1 FL=1|jgi:hypothetical protein
MKLKFVAVAALVVAGVGAHAEDITVSGLLVPMSNTLFFGQYHQQAGLFTDTFTFNLASPQAVFASASLVTINLGGGQNIDFTSATLNGTSLALSSPFPGFDVGGVIGSGPWPAANPQLTLVLKGTTDAGLNGNYASYSGTLNVSPVPEPETLAMMLAGLGALGFLARRRQND